MPTGFDQLHLTTYAASSAAPNNAQLTAAIADTAFNLGDLVIMLLNFSGDLVWLSEKAKEMTGYTVADLRQRPLRIFYQEHPGDCSLEAQFHQLQSGGLISKELQVLCKSGFTYWAMIKIQRVAKANGHSLVCIHDLTRPLADASLIAQLRFFDTMTGLPNWPWLQDQLTVLFEHASEHEDRLAFLLINLNRFKAINDAMGEVIGNFLIETVSERLTSARLSGALIARRGGDEFCVALPGVNRDGAETIANQLLAAIAEPVHLGLQQFDLTASIGISLYPEHGDDPALLIGNAGTALHEAKRKGLKNVCIYSEQLMARALRRRNIENGLRRALERNEFRLCYQPQVRLDDLSVTGVEALLRWLRPDGEFISPAEFIPVAEQSGQIIAIGEWVLYQACIQGKAWHDAGQTHLQMAVNLSPCQFRQANLIDMIEQVLNHTGFPPHLLELEITEGVLMEDPERAELLFTRLRAIGVTFAIDDFGTGYSSLAYLKRFKLNRLKIDRSFITDCCNAAEDRAIVDSIIRLADNLGLNVVAEGVESDGHVQILRERGCGDAQGYLFSAPLSPEAFWEWHSQRQFEEVAK